MILMFHRVYHDTLNTASSVGALVATWAAFNAERLQFAMGVVLAVGSSLWSWYLSLQSKKAEEDRRQRTLDDETRREQRWADFEQRIKMIALQKEAGVTIDLDPQPKPQ